METEKFLSEKEADLLKVSSEHLPVIEVKNEKTCCKKSATILSKPKLSFPKLKSDEIPHQRAEAGEPGSYRSEIFKYQSRSTLATSKANFFDKNQDVHAIPKVIGISECQFGFKVPASEFINEGVEAGEENLEESHALKRWKFWLKDKIHMQNVLSKKLGKNSCDLQIQEADKCRAVFEEKLLLTYAQIPEPDRWRGHPFFWKERLRLGPRKIPDDCEIPRYVAAETKLDKGELPDLEFIGIPKAIQMEKNQICRSENLTLNKWEKMPYRQKQVLNFKDQRKKMKPHNILMDELAIVGTKITKEQEEPREVIEVQNVPEIIVTEESSYCTDFRQSIFCLAIDGEEIKYELGNENCQNLDKVFTWQVNFGTNKTGSLVEKVLRVENRGTLAVAYDWISEKNNQKQDLNLQHPKIHEPWFFFNKNSGLFLPGQIYDLKFYLKAEFSGIRKEIWYLKTKPPLWHSREMGTIVLSAVVTEDFSCKKHYVEAFLRKRVGDAVVRFALDVIFYKVFNPSEGLRQIEYRSLFNEKELFEYHNPKHYYHSVIVKELNKLFYEISFSHMEWDFSLSSFITMVRCGNNNDEEVLLQKAVKNAQKLLRPNYLYVRKLNKYKMTYEILCKMASLMEEDYIYLRNLFFKKKNKHKSSSTLKVEEMGEEFDETPMVFKIEPKNFLFFQTILYFKVHARLGEAIECIVGVLETNKLFEPWQQRPKLVKPSRRK